MPAERALLLSVIGWFDRYSTRRLIKKIVPVLVAGVFVLVLMVLDCVEFHNGKQLQDYQEK
jgi:uncharacterized membrane protein (Fun14 family)